jgi:transposase-like protein
MDTAQPFKWRHFQAEIILLCIRWYLWYPLSYKDLREALWVKMRKVILRTTMTQTAAQRPVCLVHRRI